MYIIIILIYTISIYVSYTLRNVVFGPQKCSDKNKSLVAVIYFLKGTKNKEIWSKLSFKKN